MSISKTHLRNDRIRREVREIFSEYEVTISETANRVGITAQTATAILKEELSNCEFKKIKSDNYSISKIGDKNPMTGKRGPEIATYVGDCDDGHGYKTRLVNGKRYFTHRINFAKALNIDVSDLPSTLHVHHIDGDKQNNRIDNLALCTSVGHRLIHSKQNVIRNNTKNRALRKRTRPTQRVERR